MMGTKSIIRIHEARSVDKNERVVCAVYNTYNGQPEFIGETLVKWLQDVSFKDLVFDNVSVYRSVGGMAIQLCDYLQKNSSNCEIIQRFGKKCQYDYIYDFYYINKEFWISVYRKDTDLTIRLPLRSWDLRSVLNCLEDDSDKNLRFFLLKYSHADLIATYKDALQRCDEITEAVICGILKARSLER